MLSLVLRQLVPRALRPDALRLAVPEPEPGLASADACAFR